MSEVFIPRALIEEAELVAAKLYRAGYEAGFAARSFAVPRWCVMCERLIPADRGRGKTCSERCGKRRILARARQRYRGG